MDNNGVNLSQPKPLVPNNRRGSSVVVIILAVLVIIGIGVAAFVVMGKSGVKKVPNPTQSSAGETASLEKDLNSLEIEEINADFTGVEQDLKGL